MTNDISAREINIDDILYPDIASHGQAIENYVHNTTPVIAIKYADGHFDLLTGGHRYNSAVAGGYATIDAYVIAESDIDFETRSINDIWEINEQDEIIDLLGADNF